MRNLLAESSSLLALIKFLAPTVMRWTSATHMHVDFQDVKVFLFAFDVWETLQLWNDPLSTDCPFFLTHKTN